MLLDSSGDRPNAARHARDQRRAVTRGNLAPQPRGGGTEYRRIAFGSTAKAKTIARRHTVADEMLTWKRVVHDVTPALPKRQHSLV